MRKVLSFRRGLLFVCIALGLAVIYLAVDRPQQAQEQNSRIQPFSAYKKFAQRDALTDEIRSPYRELVRVEINSEADRAAVNALAGSVVQDFGSFAVVAKSKRTSNAIAGVESRPIGGKVHLPGGTFDPVASPPAETVADGAASISEEKGYYVVQFGGIATDEWLNSIRDAGVEILQYVPDQAFFVYGDEAAISRVASHSRVRWVGKYTREQRIPEDVQARVAALRSKASKKSSAFSGQTAMFDVAVFARADLADADDKIARSISGRVLGSGTLPYNFFNLVRVEIPVAEVEQVASIPEVIRIDQAPQRVKEDERAAQIVAGNYSGPTTIAGPGYNPQFQFGVNGAGVTVAVSDDGVSIPGDGGFYLTSGNTKNGPLRGAAAGATTGHGHLNASIIAGDAPFGALDPLGYNYGLGIAPKANIINIPILRPDYLGLAPNSDATAIDDTVNSTGVNGVRASITNNSWGDTVNSNKYDSYAALFDGLVRDGSFATSIDPISIIFSAGNCGNNNCSPTINEPPQNGLTRPKVAKNIITVGSSENFRPEFSSGPNINANNIEDLAASSSRGPAFDGRVKPDIIAPGGIITGSRAGTSCNGVFQCFDTNHSWSYGTSHAAPQVAGAAALFTQFWKDINGASSPPSPAMVKAAILSSGQDMNGANSGTAVPNGNEGWGRINMKYMMDLAALTKRIDQTVQFSNVGDTFTLSGSVNDPSRPVRVALVWTDPPAVTDPALVNDLDLTVTVGGNTYRGNVFSGGNSIAGGSFDSVNNVEQVWLPAGIAGGTPYSITIRASRLNGNGIPGPANPDTTDQDFALVAYNFSEDPPLAFYSVSGQVVSQSGRGVAKAMVTMTGQDGVPRRTMTNPFGYFAFANVAAPQSYTIMVAGKRNVFNPINVSVNNSNVTSLLITSVKGGP